MAKKHAPRFIGRASNEGYNLRAYLHESGRGVFPKVDTRGFNAIADHFFPTVKRYQEGIGKDGDYTLAFIWGDDGVPVIDFCRFSGIDGEWPGNPEMMGFVFRNGIYSPGEPITCEDGIIIMGSFEAPYRRTTENLNAFLRNPPEIPGVRWKFDSIHEH